MSPQLGPDVEGTRALTAATRGLLEVVLVEEVLVEVEDVLVEVEEVLVEVEEVLVEVDEVVVTGAALVTAHNPAPSQVNCESFIL